MQNPPSYPRAGLLRRLAAICYDSLLLGAVLFFTSFLVVLANGGQSVKGYNPLVSTLLFIVAFFFFAWFWIHGGQTLGMRAWRLRVQRFDGQPISWNQALLRYLVSILSWLLLGLGYFWQLVDRQSLTWHDRYSESELVLLPKQS